MRSRSACGLHVLTIVVQHQRIIDRVHVMMPSLLVFRHHERFGWLVRLIDK